MILKSDAKFEEKLTLGSKKDMSNLMNFRSTSQKSENFTSMFLRKAYKFWAK